MCRCTVTAPRHKSARGLLPKRWTGLAVGLAAVLSVGLPIGTSAATYQLDYEFSIPVGVLGSSPATVTLTDLGNNIRFSILNTLAGSKLKSFFFNFNGDSFGKDPDDLSFSNVKVNGSTLASSKYEKVLAPSETSTLGSLRADGDGYFDGKIAFKSSHFLAFGETLTFDLSLGGSHNLAESHFQHLSISGPGGSPGPFLMATHVQNVNPAGDSHWVAPNPNPAPVPLPGALWLFGTGALAIVRMVRKPPSRSPACSPHL